MAATPMASSWFARSGIRLRIWHLQLWLRVVQTTWFKTIVIRPVVYVGLWWIVAAVLSAVFLGRRLPEEWSSNPQIAHKLTELRQKLDSRASRRLTERERAIGQTITWGMAGVGVIILTTIVTARVFNPAIWVATAAFAVAVPFLVVLGAAGAIQNDPKSAPPTLRATLFLQASIFLAHLVFCSGLAALLWSYDARIAVIFVGACCMAWRYVQRFVAEHAASQTGQGD
jgi:hypothetical protein